MKVCAFVEALAAIKLPSVFNPYSDVCQQFDRLDGPARRRANLRAHLDAALRCGVDTIWVARDLGYRGGRRTGLALTDEAHLQSLERSFGFAMPVSRATTGPAVAERTARVVWNVIERLPKPVFTWNIFPLHPHLENEPLTNRCHTAAERIACDWVLGAVLELLRPSSIVAIGNDAARGLMDLKIECLKVRHPSYGGQREFVEGICKFHQIGPTTTLKEDHQPRFSFQSKGAAA